jgi:hypothetical protein
MWFRVLVRAALIAVAVCAFWVPSAGAIEAVIWSGGIAPGDTSRGVHVRADGRLQPLSASGPGAVSRAPVLTPSAAAVARIRAALRGVRRAPPYTRPPSISDGGYVTAIVDGDGSSAAAIAVGQTPTALATVVGRLNAALPDARRLSASGSALRLVRAEVPPRAACPGGGDATTAVKKVSLDEAVGRGLVQLSAKGGNQGDVVRVEGQWKSIPGPVTLRIPVEFVQDKSPTAVGELAAPLGKKMSQTIRKGPYAGTRLDVQLDFKLRAANAPATPCFHQIRLVDNRPDFRSYNASLGFKPASGEWSALDPGVFVHELWHLAGFPDRYGDFFEVGRRLIPLPQVGLKGKALMDELRRSGVKPSQGRVISKPQRGHENELMGNNKKPIAQDDLNAIVERAEIQVTGDPGEILVNKADTDQNMLTGRGLSFSIPYRGDITLAGMEAYCLDQHEGSPVPGTRFDLMGPAAARPEPAYQALARVAAVIAARPPPQRPFAVPGAQSAVWRITDALAGPGVEAEQILREAQVPLDVTFAAPHFADPNAASPDTGRTTDSAPVPPLPAAPNPPALPAPALGRVRIVGPVPPARTRTVLAVRLSIGGVGVLEDVRVALYRVARRGSVRVFFSPLLRFPDGQTDFSISVPKLTPGTHRLVVLADRGARRTATFKVLRRGSRG